MTDTHYQDLLARIDQLENANRRRFRCLWFAFGFLFVIFFADKVLGSDTEAAWEDRRAQPADIQPYLFYFTSNHLPEARRLSTEKVFAYVVCSLSSTVPLEEQLPVRIKPGLYRINTQVLGWHDALPKVLLKSPYRTHPTKVNLVTRMNWFVRFICDNVQSGDSYFELIFGKPVKKVSELYELADADIKSPVAFARIIDESGVAIPRNGGSRWVKAFPTTRRVDLWQTYDFFRVGKDQDPLENLTGAFDDNNIKYDATELIGGLVKSWWRDGRRRNGHLQFYALGDGDDNIVPAADIKVVYDKNPATGPELRNCQSCMSCHQGYKALSVDSFGRYIRSGAEVYTSSKEEQLKLDNALQGGIDDLINDANAEFEATVKAINGLTPADNSLEYALVVADYDSYLTLERAAQELYTTPQGLQRSVANLNNSGVKITARVAQLVQGVRISRVAFEDNFQLLLQARRLLSLRKQPK